MGFGWRQAEGDALAAAAPVQPENEAPLFPRAPVIFRIDAEGTVPAMQAGLSPFQIVEAGFPHQRSVAEDPDFRIVVNRVQ